MYTRFDVPDLARRVALGTKHARALCENLGFADQFLFVPRGSLKVVARNVRRGDTISGGKGARTQ